MAACPEQFRNCLPKWDSRPRLLLPRSEFYLSRVGIRRLFTFAQSSSVGLVSMVLWQMICSKKLVKRSSEP